MIHRHCMMRNGDGVIDLFLCLDVSEKTFFTETLNYFFSANPKTMSSAQYPYVLYMVKSALYNNIKSFRICFPSVCSNTL